MSPRKDDDEENELVEEVVVVERPTFQLSGLLAHRKHPPQRQRQERNISTAAPKRKKESVETNHQRSLSKPAATQANKRRRRPRDLYDSPPIPSSFVDNHATDVLAQLEEDFFAEQEETTKKQPRPGAAATKQNKMSQTKPATDKKEEVDPHHEQNGKIRTATRLNESDDEDDDDDDLFQPVFVRKKSNQPTAKESSQNPPAAPKDVTTTTVKNNSKPAVDADARSKPAAPPNTAQPTSNLPPLNNNNDAAAAAVSNEITTTTGSEQQQLRDTVRACYQAADWTTSTKGDLVQAVAAQRGWSRAETRQHRARVKEEIEALLVSEKKKESSSLSSSRQQQPQPDTATLHAAVDQVFAATATCAERLRTCSVGEFLAATQAQFDDTCKFSKETRRRVKERVAYLLQQQQPAIHSRNDDLPKEAAVATAPLATAAASAKIPDSEVAKEKKNASEEEAVAANPKTRPPYGRTLRSTSEQQLQQQSAVAAKDKSSALSEKSSSEPLLAKNEESTTTTEPVAKSSVAPQPFKPKKVADTDKEKPKKDDESASDKPKKAAPRRRRQPKVTTAKTTASLNDTATTYNIAACEHSDPAPSEKAPAKGRKRGRAATTSCTLCAKCPCRLRSRDSSSSSNTMEFAQSDAAIEKALIKRLLKLEETTDQYDEQTDAVRRRLKKHRRDVWKKREDLLRRYDEQEAKRKGTSSSSRFLPDVDEFNQYLETEHRQKKRRTAKAVAKGQAVLFGTVRAKTVQPTLTQMLGGGSDEDDDGSEEVQTETSPEKKQKADACDSDGNHQTDEESTLLEEEEPLCEPPSPVKAHRIEPKENTATTTTATAPQSDDNADRSSIWDAVRHGNYTSAWDRLFHEETDDLGVDHLLGLLGSTQEEDVPSPESENSADKTPALTMMSQSSLSTRGRSLAEEITDQICGDECKRAAVERVCPNWKENIAFAMGRKNEADVSEALQNVRDTQAKLRQAKLKILQKIEQQEVALGIFEETLQQSLTRFSSATTETPGPNKGGTQPMLEVAIPAVAPAAADGSLGPRHSIASSEVGTILSSPLSPGATNLSAVATTGESKPLNCFADETANNEEAMVHCHVHHPGTPLSVAASPGPLAVASQ